jgi:hypothetical protein
MIPPEQVRQAKNLNRSILLARPNVVGVGISYKSQHGQSTDELSVAVLVSRKIPRAALSAQQLIPEELDGVRTDVIQVGELRALQSRLERWRPAPGGVSIAHYRVSAGTLGCVVRDRGTGTRLILSNNHVLADSNAGNPGDVILQPGPADGGQQNQDVLAHLERYCSLQFNEEPGTCAIADTAASLANAIARLLRSSHRLQSRRVQPQAANLVDAAVARPLADSEVLDDILEVGMVTGAAQAELNMNVRKSGRTTGFTTGQITVLDATLTVNYGSGRNATFDDQIVSTPMSQGGDSGSLLVTGDPPLAVGLLFAGSDQSTIYNPIQAVLDCLNVSLSSQAPSAKSQVQVSVERAEAVKAAHQSRLMNKPNVVGVGVGLRTVRGERTNTPAVVVMVSKKLPRSRLAPQDVIPAEIDGVPVDVQEIGELTARM